MTDDFFASFIRHQKARREQSTADGKLHEKQKAPSYGYLAALKLLKQAAFDRRVTQAALRDFTVLISYICDGYCYASTEKIAALLGVRRQAVQQRLHLLERLGYFRSFRSYGYDGRERCKDYFFDLSDVDFDFCRWRPTPQNRQFCSNELSDEGPQAPEPAGSASPGACPPPQEPELAQRNPIIETYDEETWGEHSTFVHQSIPPATQVSTTTETEQLSTKAWQHDLPRNPNAALKRIQEDLLKHPDVFELMMEKLTGNRYKSALRVAVQLEQANPGAGAMHLMAETLRLGDG